MPDPIRQLARATFLAQQLLIQDTVGHADIVRRVECAAPTTKMTEHYNDHQMGKWHPLDTGRRGSDGLPARVFPVSTEAVPSHDKVGRAASQLER